MIDPAAQQHAAIWNNGNGGYGMSGHRRLAMNGSQPCLMLMSGDPHLQGPMFHHYYHHHIQQQHPHSVDKVTYKVGVSFNDQRSKHLFTSSSLQLGQQCYQIW